MAKAVVQAPTVAVAGARPDETKQRGASDFLIWRAPLSKYRSDPPPDQFEGGSLAGMRCSHILARIVRLFGAPLLHQRFEFRIALRRQHDADRGEEIAVAFLG